MDARTLDAYATNAQEIAARHARVAAQGGGVSRHFARAFGPDDRILDVGAGAGRDLSLLVAEGRVAYGLEPVAQMRDEALSRYPELGGKLLEGTLPDALPDLEPLGGPFDGVLCSAVLQHVSRSGLLDAVFALRRLLRPGGRALVSIPTARDDLGADGRDDQGRLFNGVQPGELTLLFERVGFRALDRWEGEDSLGRTGARWATILFQRAADGPGGRPLECQSTRWPNSG